MTLSLNIGSGPIAPVQIGPIGNASLTFPVTFTLPLPSTAGTTLLAIAGNATTAPSNVTVASFPAGWTRVISKQEPGGLGSDIEIWAYYGNPGGISSVTFQSSSNLSDWWGNVSEWANVAIISQLEASGTASATSGTTLAPTTSGNILTAGDLAISAWVQREAAATTCNFTTPGGWTRLIDSGSSVASKHIDAEYKINPATGATLGPTLTSDVTTTTTAGVIIALKAAPPVADQAIYLVYGSLTLKLNTLDFALVDCPTPIQNLATVTLSDPGNYPDWTGTVSQVQARDVVDISSGHHFQVITATNTQAPNFTGAPFNLSDNPATNTADIWLLENGDMWALENGSGDWLMESSVQEEGYRELSIGSQVGATSPAITLVTLGYVTVFRVGLWVGMTFKLTSSNLANWITAPGSLYTIATITVTYQGANPPQPVYAIQFSDAAPSDTTSLSVVELKRRQIQTLEDWTRAHAT